MMTLFLVLLMGSLLAGIAWKSATQALDAQSAVEDLQRRWAITSLQSTLIGQSENILARAEEDQFKKTHRKTPVPRLSFDVQLAGFEYRLLFTDELAKLNINSILQNRGISTAIALVSKYAKPSPQLSQTQSISSYEQMFDDFSPAPFSSNAINTITCFSLGSVNIRRASDDVLSEALTPHLRLGQIKDLLAARNRDPFCELNVLLDSLDSIDQATKTKLHSVLSDSSNFHSLWIVASNSQRSWTSLALHTGGPTTRPTNPGRQFNW